MNHFLHISDLSPQNLQELLDLAADLKSEWRSGGNRPLLKGKSMALIFQKPSLRTRVSFEMGMQQLGGHALYLSPNEIKMGGRESVGDVARVLSGYVDGIMARVFDHDHILQLAKYASVPVINGLSEYNHPAQALADVFTIYENRPQMAGLKVAYVGDGNNVTRSLMFACVMLGMHVAVAAPDGYQLSEADYEKARQLSQQGATVWAGDDPITAVTDADIIYTDVWTSMGQEAEAEQRRQIFPPYQVNQQLLTHAKPDCLVMHCLPAHRGEEITDEVADGPNSVLFPQAHNRLHAQKAILVKLLSN